MPEDKVTVIGGGLAGCEAAWQIARAGIPVVLYEMRPDTMTPAHRSGDLAELVCSNSLGSRLPDRATGLLQAELRMLDSLIMRVAERTAVPAGGALAVDRRAFAGLITEQIAGHPLIELRRCELSSPPTDGLCVVCTGPLTSPAMEGALAEINGRDHLFFFDAMAPVVEADSLDQSICFRASRRQQEGEGDYLNCPFDREEYDRFIEALLEAERIPLPDFESVEDPRFFEGCLPIEEAARRGPQTLAFGPLRPVGLRDPRTGRRPHAVVQLRRDNLAGTLYNLVGFQTNLRWGEQERVFRMIPGLAKASFASFGQMHRNTFIDAPRCLGSGLESRFRSGLYVAGQLAGVEGYLGSVGTGCLAGRNAVRRLRGLPPLNLPPETMLGALLRYLSATAFDRFQPVKANFGLLPPLAEPIRKKRERFAALARRSLELFGQ